MSIGPKQERCDFCGEPKGSLPCRAKHKDPLGLRESHEQYVRDLEAKVADLEKQREAFLAEAARPIAETDPSLGPHEMGMPRYRDNVVQLYVYQRMKEAEEALAESEKKFSALKASFQHLEDNLQNMQQQYREAREQGRKWLIERDEAREDTKREKHAREQMEYRISAMDTARDKLAAEVTRLRDEIDAHVRAHRPLMITLQSCRAMLPEGPMSIEEHGEGEALYLGRTNERHGLNIVHLTEPAHQWPQVREALVGIVNAVLEMKP